MAGDPSNASVWPDADVYVAPLGSTVPANVSTAFNGSWDLVGLLDGEQGFTQTRNEEVNDFFAWGGALVRTTRRNFKLTVRFVALEDNDTTHNLIWPNSAGGELVVPRPERVLIAFETTEDEKVRRLISAYQAEVSLDGDIVDNETDLTRYELLATIFPDTTTSPYTLLTEQKTQGGS